MLYSILVVFVIHWHESAMDLHVFPIPIPPPGKTAHWLLQVTASPTKRKPRGVTSVSCPRSWALYLLSTCQSLFFLIVHLFLAALVLRHCDGLQRVGATLLGGACALGCAGSVIVAWGLWSRGSVFVARGLSCSAAWGGLPWPEIKLVFPALAGEFWTTREAPRILRLFYI